MGRRGSTDDLEDGGTEANGTDPTRFLNVKSSASGKGVNRSRLIFSIALAFPFSLSLIRLISSSLARKLSAA
jgi:hypothetical protein